ncbi:MAG: hypothetical protein WCO68_02610 [Verrucomicrobiota bacterium]
MSGLSFPSWVGWVFFALWVLGLTALVWGLFELKTRAVEEEMVEGDEPMRHEPGFAFQDEAGSAAVATGLHEVRQTFEAHLLQYLSRNPFPPGSSPLASNSRFPKRTMKASISNILVSSGCYDKQSHSPPVN